MFESFVYVIGGWRCHPLRRVGDNRMWTGSLISHPSWPTSGFLPCAVNERHGSAKAFLPCAAGLLNTDPPVEAARDQDAQHLRDGRYASADHRRLKRADPLDIADVRRADPVADAL